MKMKVLHLIGSPSSEFHFHCSALYARSLLECDYGSYNKNIIAAIHPDGLWSFPKDFKEDLLDRKKLKKYKTAEAIKIIEALVPDVMVQHIQCDKKLMYSALFEVLGIPFVGCDAQVTANTVDKGVTRAILTQAGVKMPDGLVVTKEENDWEYNGAFPAVVKPTKMENSVGVELVQTKEEMDAAIERAWAFGEALIIDAFVPGREVRCGAVELVDGEVQALGCIEYKVTRDSIRTYADKLSGNDDKLQQNPETKSWFIDEDKEPSLVRKLQQIAVRIHQAMGCRDFSQYDCRVTEDGEVFVLEVNSFCSFGPLSLVPKIAAKEGISSEKLYKALLDKAAARRLRLDIEM